MTRDQAAWTWTDLAAELPRGAHPQSGVNLESGTASALRRLADGRRTPRGSDEPERASPTDSAHACVTSTAPGRTVRPGRLRLRGLALAGVAPGAVGHDC